MLDPKSFDSLARAIREVARPFRGGNVCQICALDLVCTTVVFFSPIGAMFIERSSATTLAAVVIVWIAAKVVCAGLCLTDRARSSGNSVRPTLRSPGSATDGKSYQGPRLVLFMLLSVLLAITAGLVVLFASGLLRFGLEGPFVFLVYVFAGLVVALICFGILSSHAQASGSRYGINVMLGGPIVALVVVAGGGAVYEREVRPPGTLNLRVYFYEEDRRERVPVSGTFSIELPNRSLEQRIDADGGASFQELPVSLSGQEVPYSLKSPEYQIHPDESRETIQLGGAERVLLRVKRKASSKRSGAP